MRIELARAFDLGADFSCTLINESENKTFRISCEDGRNFALRLARPGYHTDAELQSELAWLESINQARIVSAPKPQIGRNGQYVQTIAGQRAVLFHWLKGEEPQIKNDLNSLAETTGAIAAQMHEHVLHWQRPTGFTRPRWDFAASLGDVAPRWGHWKRGLGVTQDIWPVLGRAVETLKQRLASYGEAPARFNLIHADLRLANLLQDGAAVKVIDFDDCGFGWLLYDAATFTSFHEHEPQVPELMAHWVQGYRRVRPLLPEDEAIIPTLIMFRRLLLLAWLGSHSHIDLAQQLRPTFAAQTLELCERYLKQAS